MEQADPILVLMEENLQDHVSFIQRHSPSMRVDDGLQLLVVDSGLPTDTFNKIMRVRLEGDLFEPVLRTAMEGFDGRLYSVWLGPCDQPSVLEPRLASLGLVETESELGMAAAAQELPASIAWPEGLEILEARTEAAITEFAEINAANWQPPDPSVLAFFDSAKGILLREGCPMRLFVGYLDGAAVAAGELFLSEGGAAGLHMVSTRAEFQRRGIGLALTWHLADTGRRAGAKHIVLQASPQGEPVYRRLGFRPRGKFTEYQPAS